MPTIQSAEIWKESGRYEEYGEEILDGDKKTGVFNKAGTKVTLDKTKAKKNT